jgi:hypothetical protein
MELILLFTSGFPSKERDCKIAEKTADSARVNEDKR